MFLNEDDRNYVEPDISVICDKSKLNDKGYYGAPDWIIEIISPSTRQIDYGIKLFKYRTAVVREYWIVNPLKKTVTVFDLENDEKSNQYDFDETISSCFFDDFDIAKRLENTMADLDADEALMFSGEPLDEETRELLKASLENSIRIAKINAKQKFTPKKYRNNNE